MTPEPNTSVTGGLARLLAQATPGPWLAEMSFVGAEDGREVASAHGETYVDSDCNARLIALAPDTVSLLIDMAQLETF